MTDAPWLDRIRARALAPVDVAGLAAVRVAVGLLGLTSCLRFLHYGWVEEFFVRPAFFFKYAGFEWVAPLSGGGMRALFVALAAASACIALGLFYRAAIVFFFLGFTYVQLVDATNYLNHYYLVSLLALLLATMPLGRTWGLDGWLRRRSVDTLPAWCLFALRFQVGVVYCFAGLAKANADWLLHGQPLGIWLSARSGMPVVGSLFAEPLVALVMSWAGFLYDTTVPLWLSLRRTRRLAFAAVIVFHAITWLLFPIGMFPFIMVVAATIFFAPDWPRRLLRLRPADVVPTPTPAKGRIAFAIALSIGACFGALQILVPLRAHLYGGNVHWHEQGMRLSWRVMVREKNGSVTYLVEDPETGRVREVSPRKYLDDRQLREFSAQPDLIVQLGKHIARDFEGRTGHPVIIKVDAIASLNGRHAQRLVDPDVDLARLEDGLSRASWILPAPSGPPIRLQAPRPWTVALSEHPR
jgi:hypothetical protein